jgi:pre-mRNA-splicing factor SYF2
VLEDRDLRIRGEDVERHRNMKYSLEDNERWVAKVEEKERRKDQGPGEFGDAAERAYPRQLKSLKPDVSRYRKQRDAAEALKANSSASGALRALGFKSRFLVIHPYLRPFW